MTLLKDNDPKNINIALLSIDDKVNKLSNIDSKITALEDKIDKANIADVSALEASIARNTALINAETNSRESADTDLENAIDNKVDKVEGKGLSTNDFTNEDKIKLDSLENIASTYSKLELTSLWSGTSSTGAQNITLSSSITNFKFILVAGLFHTSTDEQKQTLLIPVSNAMYSTTNVAWMMCGSPEQTDRRLMFGFTSSNVLSKFESYGTQGHLPVLTNVWGIK